MLVYDPRTSTSLFSAVPMRAVVSRPSVLVRGHGDERRRLATSSPGTTLNLSPVASSVLNISANAVASHSSSVRPDRLWNPRTATDLRTGSGCAVLERIAATGLARWRNEYQPRPTSA